MGRIELNVITLVQVAIYKETSVWITKEQAAEMVEMGRKR